MPQSYCQGDSIDTPLSSADDELTGAIARRLGDPRGLAQAFNLRLHAIEDPFKLAERLDLTAELTALAARVGSSDLAWHAANHRASALFESGDIVGAEQSFAELQVLGGELGQPFHMHHARMGRAMLAIMRGAPDAEAEAFAAFELGMARELVRFERLSERLSA